MVSIYSLESHTKIVIFFLLQPYEKPQHLFMLEAIQLLLRDYAFDLVALLPLRTG